MRLFYFYTTHARIKELRAILFRCFIKPDYLYLMEDHKLNVKTMKAKVLMLFILIHFSSCIYSQPNSIKDLIGAWEGKDSLGRSGRMVVIDSTDIIFTIQNKGTGYARYTIDFGKDPMWFDITMPSKKGTVVLKGFLKFINHNEIKWQLTFDDERKNGFLQETDNNTVLLRPIY